MKINKPKFWDQKDSFFYYILYPLSLFFLISVYLKKKITKPLKFKIQLI